MQNLTLDALWGEAGSGRIVVIFFGYIAKCVLLCILKVQKTHLYIHKQ